MITHTSIRHPGIPRSAPPTEPAPDGTAVPIPVAVDLGSAYLTVWADARGVAAAPTSEGRLPLVRRGRITDSPGCVSLLSRLIHDYPQPVPAGAVVVACRPVLATKAEQLLARKVLTRALAPSRLLFIDTVRAAAIGSGAAAGRLLIADVGAQLTEVALLDDGRVVAARRIELGTQDLSRGAGPGMLSDAVARALRDVRQQSTAYRPLRPALTRGLVLVGNGAAHPELTDRLADRLGIPVHRAAAPHSVALTGASLAATAAIRHPAVC